ncbi:MAG: prolyl oligopeptidase family serine peptidase [Phycisphaerae bacterium]|jgi:poly(3-hydroxybutyrate) depolymerase|nr:prolyl oligopeptidase family serine peptidase [Phycisphaerae bacterium]
MRVPALLLAALSILASADVGAAQSKTPDRSGRQGNLRLEVVTFPPGVQAGFKDLNKQALLFHPIQKPEGKTPLIILLHGAGGTRKTDISSFKVNRDVKWVMTPANRKYKAKILVPQSRSLWDPASLSKMLDHILSANSDIDEDRVYCIGYSMGGKGVWEWAMSSPKRFAAIIPVAFIADLSKLKDMTDLPIWAMVGTKDRRRAGGIPKMAKALKELGSTSVRTTIFEGANHASTARKAWAQEGLLDWLFAQSRKKTDASSANGSRSAKQLQSGEYFITQSWSQETDYKRPYFVNVPADAEKKALPVFVFLHGNGGSAKGSMRRYARPNCMLAKKYIMIFPNGYRASWNIVSERSKADDLGFIEAIVKDVSKYDNVRKDNISIMGNSNGAALVNQIACETRLAGIRNYISAVSPLNGYQHDGANFKVKGDDNNYKVIAKPMTGKRLMNISGVNDSLVPYKGGPSKHIPAKGGKLRFVDAEESIFLWAKHMGYKGKKLTKPTRTDGKLEIFSYLDGAVIHYKVVNAGHNAGGAVSEKLILEFLERKK